jgi:hypothetical protein
MKHPFSSILACAFTVGAVTTAVQADRWTDPPSRCVVCRPPRFSVSTKPDESGSWIHVHATGAGAWEPFEIYIDNLPGRTAPLLAGVVYANDSGVLDFRYAGRCWSGAGIVPVRAVSRRNGANYQVGYTDIFSC